MNACWVAVDALEQYDTTDGVVEIIHKAIALRESRGNDYATTAM